MPSLTPHQREDSAAAENQHTGRAIGAVCSAVILYSFIPISLDRLVGGSSPMIVGVGTVIGYIIFTEADRRYLVTQLNSAANSSVDASYRGLIQQVRSHKASYIGILGALFVLTVTGPDYLIFAASTVYVDTAVTSSIYELWPMLWLLGMIVVDANRFGGSVRSRRPWHTYALMFLGLPALTLIITSTVAPSDATGATSSFPLLGVSLALIAPIMGALGVASFWFADRMMYQHPSEDNSVQSSQLHAHWKILENEQGDSREIRKLTNVLCDTSQIVGQSLSLIALIPFAIVESRAASASSLLPLLGGIVVGAVLNGPASVGLRRAHILTKQREIISLQYLSPVLALLWLSLGSSITISRLDFLIIGTITVVAINMLINLDTEGTATDSPNSVRSEARVEDYVEPHLATIRPAINERHSLRSLVLGLLVFGSLIYFRPELMRSIDIAWAPGNFWSALALTSTIFALLYAFRLSRVESLLALEDQRTLDLVRRMEVLPSRYFAAWRPNTRGYVLDWVILLNQADTLSDYRHCYTHAQAALYRIEQRLRGSEAPLSSEERKEIAELRAELDGLAHGRQHAREFAERLALWLLGAAIVAMATTVPESESPWAAFMASILGTLLSSVVVFLLAHLADLRRSRRDVLIQTWTATEVVDIPNGYSVQFRHGSDATWQRVFAVIIVVGILAALIGLLGQNRMVF